MNIHAITSRKVILATLLAAVVLRASADPSPKIPEPGRSFTGVVTCVDTNKQVFHVKRPFWPARQFAYGGKCEMCMLYAMLQNGMGMSVDLRPGEKVTVGYQDARGVHIACRIEQQRMHVSGTVKELNAEKRRLTLHRWTLDKQMNIASDCITLLGADKAGTLADIHPGDRVDVVYETPGGAPVAWQITRTGKR